MDSIAAGGGPLIPFTLTLDVTDPDPRYHELRQVRYVGEYLEDMLAQAQASIDPGLEGMDHVSMYALAWDGYATVDGRRRDAILVEAGTADSGLAALRAGAAGPSAAPGPRCRSRARPARR
jgi:hypothetical protein